VSEEQNPLIRLEYFQIADLMARIEKATLKIALD
jgi:hypothetical protein